MTRLFLFILLILMSCDQPEKAAKQSAPGTDVMDSADTTLNNIVRKRYSPDEIYLRYISKDLWSYIEKNHPAWSVPNQNLWYPQLFRKYQTSASLVNYIRGDFDCNGQADEALILDKGKNNLGAVAFLRTHAGFQTVELKEMGRPGDRIEFSLSLYKPGRYDIADPDLGPADAKYVVLKCSSIGVGHFKELYEGGDDVYYWDKGQLRSCVIEK